MADIRNNNVSIIDNDSEHYKELYKRRGLKKISHHPTPKFRHPTVRERANVNTTGHVWVYGDRFYKLAQQYYGDVRYWWVIAWWNGYPTEVIHDKDGYPTTWGLARFLWRNGWRKRK